MNSTPHTPTLDEQSTDLLWIQLAAQAGRIGFWKSDLSTGIIDCTEVCKRNIGFPLDEQLTFEKFRRQMHPDDQELVSAAVSVAVRERSSYAVEYRTLWPDGSIHWIASRGQFVDAGEKGWLIGTTNDITETKAVELELQRQREFNTLVTRNVAEGLCFIDTDGLLTFMNDAAEKILGWTEEELRGKRPHEMLHYKKPDGSAFPAEECPLAQPLLDGVPIVEREDWWIHKDGHFVAVLCSCVPIVKDGEIQGAVLSLHDMTERKRMEDALRDASRAKDEFLATISHELRTPMTSVLGWLQYARMLPLPPEVEAAISHAEESAKAQAEIVDDLLDVSRAVTGKLRLHISDVDLRDIVASAVRNIEPSATAKRMRITTVIDGAVRVRGDATRLLQIVSNLLTNAVKFTHDGGSVSVALEQDEQQAIVRVSDSGVGIDADFLPFVFERFSQSSSTTSRTSGGLGLGLAIVRQLAELHGGSVEASSEGRGRGATFIVRLPRS